MDQRLKSVEKRVTEMETIVNENNIILKENNIILKEISKKLSKTKTDDILCPPPATDPKELQLYWPQILKW